MEALKIYLILIVNDICLIYVSYAQQLQLSHLVFINKKEVVFVPKNGKIVVKINWVTSSYKTDTPTSKSNMLQKENQNWRKVLTKFFVPNVIDRIKIKLIERCHFKVNQWLYTDRWSHKVCWQNKNYLLEKGNKWIRTSCPFT